jgi:histidinol-phosphate phosphatase family protein
MSKNSRQNCPEFQTFSNGLEKSKKIAFFDRDGTLNHDEGYTYQVNKLRILPHGASVLRFAIENEWTPVVVSNQSGIAKGFFSVDDVRRFNSNLRDELLKSDLYLDHFMFCVHDKFSECIYRKPKPGMLNTIMKQTIAVRFVMFGNSEVDSDAAKMAKVNYSDITAVDECLDLLRLT